MSHQEKYLFELEDLIVFLNNEYKEQTGVLSNISPLRLHLSIYLLSAYYGSSYGRLPVSVEGVSENNIHYPKYLTDTEFKSGAYGAVVKGVKDMLESGLLQKDDVFNKDSLNVEREAIKHDLTLYLKSITKLINEVSEFTLVDRVHEDKEWFRAYHNNRDYIDIEKVIDEYYNNFLKTLQER